jgi:hypothetical protein
MKMLLIMYSGSRSRLVPDLLDAHGARGYTELAPAHGVGETGPRQGTRAWPGSATVYFSVVPADRVEPLTDALRHEAAALLAHERLHGAVLPTETFF